MSVHPHAILAIFRLLGRWFPPPPLPAGVTYEQLHAKWKRFDRVTDILFLPVAIALIVLFYFLFAAMERSHTAALAAEYGPLKYMMGVSPVELGVYGTFVGFFATPLVGLLCLRLYLAERWPEFVLYGGQKMKMHPVKVLWLLMSIGIIPFLFVVPLRIGQFTAFTDSAVLDNNFFSLATRSYPYDRVRGIYDVHGYHGRFQDYERPEYAIRFADGTVWTTSDHGRAPRSDFDGPIMEFVSDKSGRRIVPLPFEEDAAHAPDSPLKASGFSPPASGFPHPPSVPAPPFGPSPFAPGPPPGFRR